MRTIKFAYNQPMFGEIEMRGEFETSHPDEELIELVEKSYPEAIDIEILEVIND